MMAQGIQRGHYHLEVAMLTKGEESATKPQAIRGFMRMTDAQCAIFRGGRGGEKGEKELQCH